MLAILKYLSAFNLEVNALVFSTHLNSINYSCYCRYNYKTTIYWLHPVLLKCR